MHRIGDESIIMHDGASPVNFNRLLSLNATAEYLWQEVSETEFDVEKLAGLLQARYDVEADTACRDAETFIARLQEAGVVE